MTAEIGCWVRWGKFSPTRLGYKPSDIGKVIGVRHSRSGTREIDVQFADGDVVRGASEHWFEGAPIGTGDAIAPNSSWEQSHFFQKPQEPESWREKNREGKRIEERCRLSTP